MPEPGSSKWTPTAAVPRSTAAHRFGASEGLAGVILSFVDLPGISTIYILRDRRAEALLRLEEVYALRLADGRQASVGEGLTMLPIGPDRWLAEAEPRRLAETIAGFATIVDQTGAYIALKLAGPRVRELLAKGCPIDFHPKVFRRDEVAATLYGHFHVITRLASDEPAYEIMIQRSFAACFWHRVQADAAEFGVRVSDPPQPSR